MVSALRDQQESGRRAQLAQLAPQVALAQVVLQVSAPPVQQDQRECPAVRVPQAQLDQRGSERAGPQVQVEPPEYADRLVRQALARQDLLVPREAQALLALQVPRDQRAVVPWAPRAPLGTLVPLDLRASELPALPDLRVQAVQSAQPDRVVPLVAQAVRKRSRRPTTSAPQGPIKRSHSLQPKATASSSTVRALASRWAPPLKFGRAQTTARRY